jgi:putative transposase
VKKRGRRGKQLELTFRRARKRKVAEERAGFIPHRARPEHAASNPVHVTLRAKSGVCTLRSQRVYGAIQAQIRAASGEDFRVTHLSVQANHIHAIVEAADRVKLWKGVQRLAQRVAWDVNRLSHRSGSVWRDRYHRRDLTTPRAVRNALVYVLMNIRKHTRDPKDLAYRLDTLDICSSSAWFTGWDPRAGPMLDDLRARLASNRLDACPVSPPTVWLSRVGWWKHHGSIRPDEEPVSAQ